MAILPGYKDCPIYSAISKKLDHHSDSIGCLKGKIVHTRWAGAKKDPAAKPRIHLGAVHMSQLW
jgi:hypothetical protein